MQSYYMSKSARVRLDDYICDLNLEVVPGGYACQPLSAEGFSYMWAGCKATYGIRSGKVCYEAKILDYNDVTCKDVDSHVVRVGWSTDDATLQLGEDKNSFGFGGTGKKSVNRKFANYGRRFEKGDVVGCYLAMENGWVDISYTVNGRFCGSAFKIRWMTDEALFPHLLSKNCKMEVNFGQANHPYFSLQPGYKLIDHVAPDFLIPAARCPASQNDCEIIMMVGLPGVGKSTWAMNYAKIHPSKKYVILGTDSIIDKMRVQGLHRRNNFSGRWDVLIKQASDCFNTLLKKASNLPRNLILDQTNVYASARRRKVKQYREKGYTINAMVLVPRDEDMVRRSQQRTIEEGKEVPESAVLEMKANFSIPHENEGLFDKIVFLELQREEAQELVEQYNRDSNLKGYQSNKQKGQSRHMNQTERKTNRYFSSSSDDQQQQARQPQGYQPRADNRFQTPTGPPSMKSYEEEMRVAKKRVDSSSNYGPPDKYRRSNSPSGYGRQPSQPVQQAYPAAQPYSSNYNQNDSFSSGSQDPSSIGGPQSYGSRDQWGAANQQQPQTTTTPKPYVKEELGHPLARGDGRSTSYGDNYGAANVKTEPYNQYSNVKQDQSSYGSAYPSQGQSGYDTGESYSNDPYYSQTSKQTVPAAPSQSYGPPGTDHYSYSGVKKEQSSSDGWYDQANQNYSGGDASYQSVKPDPYQQQGAYYASNQQQYGASDTGYGAEPKSESWTGQPQQSQSYQQESQQQYDKSGSQFNNSQYGSYDSYSDRSNNAQQWNQNNPNQGYTQGNQQQQQSFSGQQQGPNRNQQSSGNQYGNEQNYYGYDDQKNNAYGSNAADSYDTGYSGNNQSYGSDQYQDYSNQPSRQPNSNRNQGYSSTAGGSYPPPPGTEPKSNYPQAPSTGYSTKSEPQSWDSQEPFGQQQWDAGKSATSSMSGSKWDQRQDQPLLSRAPDRSAQLSRDTKPNSDARSSDRSWGGQNNPPSLCSDGPSGLSQNKPQSRFGDGPGQNKPQSRFSDGPGQNKPPSRFGDGPVQTKPPSRFGDGPGQNKPPSRFGDGPGQNKPPTRFGDGPGQNKPPSRFGDGPGQNKPPSLFDDGPGQNKPPSRFVDGPGQNKPPSRFGDGGPRGTGILPTLPGENPRSSEPLGPPDRKQPRDERERSPRGGDRNRRPYSNEESHSGRRDEPATRRNDRDDSRRGDRDDSHSRRGGRDSSRDESGRRGDRPDSSRRGERDSSGRGDRDSARRGDRDDTRSRSGDRDRDAGRSRHDRDRSRGDDRKSDNRHEDSRDRSKRDRPPPRDDRRPRDDRTDRSSGRPSGTSLITRVPEDPKPLMQSPKRSSPSKAPPQNATQKPGLLPLPNKSPLVSPTDKAGLSNTAPQREQSIVEEATSKLSTVDFDKLKQSLVNLRKQNLKLSKEPSPPANQSAGSDMEIEPEEEVSTNIQTPSAVAPQLRAPGVPRPRRPPPPAGRGSLLGPGPQGTRGPPRPRAEGISRPDNPRMRNRAPGNGPPRLSGTGLLGRPPPLMSDGPRQPRGTGLLGAPPRRPLLNTPNANQEMTAKDTLLQEGIADRGLGSESGLLRPPRGMRPRMMRPRLRGPRPGGMRPMMRPGPGMRPRLRPPGMRGFPGRPPLMRGGPRRMAPRLGPM